MTNIKPKAEDVARLICMTSWRPSDLFWEVSSPTVDAMRPYGNSDILGDIHDILGTPTDNVDDEGMKLFNKEQNDYALACHRAMCNAIASLCTPRNLDFIVQNLDVDFDRLSREESTQRARMRGFDVD